MDRSTGLLLSRRVPNLEVVLGHFGGTCWRRLHAGDRTTPKSLIEEDEDAFGGAVREFEEETGNMPRLDRNSSLTSYTRIRLAGSLVRG